MKLPVLISFGFFKCPPPNYSTIVWICLNAMQRVWRGFDRQRSPKWVHQWGVLTILLVPCSSMVCKRERWFAQFAVVIWLLCLVCGQPFSHSDVMIKDKNRKLHDGEQYHECLSFSRTIFKSVWDGPFPLRSWDWPARLARLRGNLRRQLQEAVEDGKLARHSVHLSM